MDPRLYFRFGNQKRVENESERYRNYSEGDLNIRPSRYRGDRTRLELQKW